MSNFLINIGYNLKIHIIYTYTFIHCTHILEFGFHVNVNLSNLILNIPFMNYKINEVIEMHCDSSFFNILLYSNDQYEYIIF